MRTFLRSVGGLIYTSIISALFGAASIWLLVRILVYMEGFWETLCALCAIVLPISWIAKRGLQLLLIPYNWLWNESIITRCATAIPATIVGLWVVTAPLRMPFHLQFGDWIISIVWMGFNFDFYYNLASMSFISHAMGQYDHNCK